MSELSDPTAALVRQLLATLEQSSLREEAHALGQRFEARDWKGLGPSDIAQVAALVGRIPSVSEPTVVVTPPGLGAPVEAHPWSPLENLAAWVDAVPHGRQLLALLEELARCDEGDEAAAILTRVFVEHLRYEAYAVDETPRLESTVTLRRLRTLARHGDFVVSLVELPFPYPWPNIFQPIFRRHPYGLVVAIAPGWTSCQFVYRTTKDASSLVQRTRALLGFLWGDGGQDNLALWVRRLELLRPIGGEDGAAMLRRAEEALATSPVEVSRQWASAPLSSMEAPPGVTWNQLPVHERRAFLQEQLQQGQRRHAWGLERALRESFPFGMALKQGLLRYRGYTLGDANSHRTAFEQGGSWVRHLTLALELVCEDGAVLPLPIAAAIPEMDEAGRFLIDGVWLRWVPRVLSGGLLVGGAEPGLLARVVEEGAEADLVAEPSEEEDVFREEDPTLDGVPPDSSADVAGEISQDDRLAEAPDSPLSFAGGSLRTLLEVAVHRKLYSLRKSVSTYVGEVRDLPRVLRAILRGLAGRDSVPLLASKVFLKAFLEPDRSRETPEGALPILRQASLLSAGHAPAWACPEVSASLPPGTWSPVLAARLTPCGELAVPLRDESGRERLRVSMLPLTQVNPRAGGQGTGPLPGWIAAQLAPFATLPIGSLRDAVPFIVRGHPLDERVRVLHVHGPKLRARATVDAPLFPPKRRMRELGVRLPAILAREDIPVHRVLVERGSTIKPGDVWLEAPLALWARDTATKALSTQRLHTVPSCDLLAHVFQMEEPAEEAEEEVEPTPKGSQAEEPVSESSSSVVERVPLPMADEVLPLRPVVPEAAERWFVPPGVQGTVVEVRDEAVRDKAGALLAWRLTLIVALEVPGAVWGQLLLPDGRVAVLEGGLGREEVPYGEDGEPVHLVIEDPSLSATPDTEIWFDTASGELLQMATSRVGQCWFLRQDAPVMGPDDRLRFRARDGEGIAATPDSPALSSAERLWWAAVRPREAASLSREARSWTGGMPGFWLHLVEVLEAADVVPPMLSESEPGTDVSTERREFRFELPQVMRLRSWATTYSREEQDAPLRWSCGCGRLQGRARAFELCLPDASGCGKPVLLRPALRKRRSLPMFRLAEPVLHPWRKETAAGLLGMTVPELEQHCIKDGALLLGIRMYKAVRQGAPGAAARERIACSTSLGEREALLRGLHAVERDVAALGRMLPGRLLMSAVSVLPAALHPTGLPRGAAERVKSPLTKAYLRVRLASDRLRQLRRSGSRLLVETARRALLAEMDALFGPVSQGRQEGEPTHLAGLLTRLWPLTRAPGLRSVVPGTFRIQGRPVRDTTASALELEVERIPSPAELAARIPVPEARQGTQENTRPLRLLKGSPRNGIVPVRLLVERGTCGVTTTGVLTAGGPVYLPVMSPLLLELSSPDFWAERAARERLLRHHLPWLFMVLGAFQALEDKGEEAGKGVIESTLFPGPSLQALRHDGVEMPALGAVGILALRELMAGLARPESRPLDFCRLVEEPRPRPCGEDGTRAVGVIEAIVQRAFPGDGALMRVSRRLLVRALVGWWKGPPSEASPSGWYWLPPLERGPPGTRRYVPPLASSAWEWWPAMAAATAPVRFLLENEGNSVEGRWSHALCLALGFKVDDLPESNVEVGPPRLEDEVEASSPGGGGVPLVPEPEAVSEPSLIVKEVGGSEGTPDELSFLKVSMEAWMSARPVPHAEKPQHEVVLLSSSMLNWLTGGSTR
jgi:hypothetical protein